MPKNPRGSWIVEIKVLHCRSHQFKGNGVVCNKGGMIEWVVLERHYFSRIVEKRTDHRKVTFLWSEVVDRVYCFDTLQAMAQ